MRNTDVVRKPFSCNMREELLVQLRAYCKSKKHRLQDTSLKCMAFVSMILPENERLLNGAKLW